MTTGLPPEVAELPIALAVMLAAATIAGATAAVSSRESRVAVLGLLIALVAAPFVADPFPDPRGIAARIAGAGLVAYPLLMVLRVDGRVTSGSRGGWPADALLAVTAALAAGAAVAGWDAAGQLSGGGQPGGVQAVDGTSGLVVPYLPATAAGVALLVLAAAPVAFVREPLRLTIGLVLGMLGLTLVQAGLSGPPSAFTDLVAALLLATIAIAGAALIRASRITRREPEPGDGDRHGEAPPSGRAGRERSPRRDPQPGAAGEAAAFDPRGAARPAQAATAPGEQLTWHDPGSPHGEAPETASAPERGGPASGAARRDRAQHPDHDPRPAPESAPGPGGADQEPDPAGDGRGAQQAGFDWDAPR